MNNVFKKVYSYTNTLAPVNEDNCFAGEDFLFVIDGATGLYDNNLFQVGSDAQWLTGFLSKFLIKELPNKDKLLVDIVNEGVKKVCEEFDSLITDSTQKNISYPSATCTIVRINRGKLEYLIIGDSPLLIKMKSDKVEELSEFKLRKLDDIALAETVNISKQKNISISQSIVYIKDTLRKHRSLLNTPEGYNSICRDDKVASRSLYGEIVFEDVSLVVVLSDGFAQHYSLLNCSENPVDFLNQLMKKPVEELYSEIISVQNSDKDYNLYPRFKNSDDATIVIGYI